MTNRSTSPASPLLSRADAAANLNIEPQTLATWACNGRYDLPYVKVGRCVKYKGADLDEFIALNTVGGGEVQH